MPDYPPGQLLRFQVHVDDVTDLGEWSKCDGLSVEFEVKEYQEGGINTFSHKLRGRAKYQNVKLTRVLNKDSERVVTWLRNQVAETGRTAEQERQNAEIVAVDSTGARIATWTLQGVCPVRWSGPSFDIGSNSAATETLELAHNGFLKA